MKKQLTVISLLLVMAVVLTGCSWNDIKSKFTGEDTTAASGSSVDLNYDVTECVTLGEYKDVEVDCTVTDDELQNAIDSLVESKTTTKKVKSGTCKKGQTVNINYSGKVNGKKFDGGTAEDQSVELGNSNMIDGFDDAIIGMKVGDTKKANLTFPTDYKNDTSLAGKKAVFTIKVNHIEKSVKPTFNDKFVAKNSEYKTVAEYKTKTKESLAKTKKDNAGSTALSTVVSNSKFNKIPEGLLTYNKSQIKKQFETQISQYGMDLSTYLSQTGMTQEQFDTQLGTYAEDTSKQQLVIEAIAKAENMTVPAEDISSQIATAVSSSGVSESEYREQVSTYYGSEKTLDELMEESLIYEKVNEFLTTNAKIKE